MRHGGAAPDQFLDGTIQPHHHGRGAPQQFLILGLRKRSTPKRHHRGSPRLRELPQDALQHLVFQGAKGRLPVALEKIADGDSRGLLNALVEVHKAAPGLRGQQPANGGLPAAHESGQADQSVAPAPRGILFLQCHV